MSIHKRLHIMALLLVLSGCTTHKTHDLVHPFGDGWRKGKVLSIGSGQDLPRTRFRDCRDDGSIRSPQTRYAHVEYRRTHLREWRVVPLPERHDLRPGDMVYVHIDDCNAPVDPAGTR